MKIVWTGPPQYHPHVGDLVTGETYDVPESIAIGEEEIPDGPNRKKKVQRGWIHQGVARAATAVAAAPEEEAQPEPA